MSMISPETALCPGGFQSYAPALIRDGCAPGTIPMGCKAARRISIAALAAGGTTVQIRPYQPLRIGAIVDIGSAADAMLDSWEVDSQSLFPRMQDGAANGIVDGLGLVSALTPELYRSGLNPLPPQPIINNIHWAELVFSSAAAGALDVWVYFVNPDDADESRAGVAKQS